MDTQTASAWDNASAGMTVEARQLQQAVEKLVIEDHADVMVFRTDTPWLSVATSLPSALPDLLTSVEDGTLTIATTPQAKSLEMASQSHMAITRSNQQASPDRVLIGIGLPRAPHIGIRGAGDVALYDVQQDGISLKIWGTGNIRAHGRVGWLKALIEGAGNVDAKNLVAGAVDLNIAGSGNIDARAEHSATVEVGGAGTVIVRGKPNKRNQVSLGDGNIIFPDD